MNSLQIKCFFAAAEHKSFTRAADALFISQPVLSRHIATFEDELGFALFIRSKNAARLKLTPAGEVLLEGLSSLAAKYRLLVERAKFLHLGFSGSLNIGTIDGQLICPPFSVALSSLRALRPDIRLNLSRHSMADAYRAIINGEIDVAFAARFNAEYDPELNFAAVNSVRIMLVIPKTHHLALRKNIRLADFKDDTFLTLPEKESPLNVEPRDILPDFNPKTLEAPNIGTLALWLEAGFGIFPLNENHSLRNNPNLVFLPIPEFDTADEVVMWRRDNPNPLISVFLAAFEQRGIPQPEHPA